MVAEVSRASVDTTVRFVDTKEGAELKRRFDEKYQTEPNSGCWLWEGKCWPYGTIWWNGAGLQASHASLWLYKNIRIEKGSRKVVLHKCDTPSCCNPDHLVVSCQYDNMVDKVLKNRQLKGKRHSNAKITEEQARAILASDKPHAQISAEFGVSRLYVTAIKNGRSWKHIHPTTTLVERARDALMLAASYVAASSMEGSDTLHKKITDIVKLIHE